MKPITHGGYYNIWNLIHYIDIYTNPCSHQILYTRYMIVRHPIGQFILENKGSGTMYLIQQLYTTLKKKHMFFQDLKEIWWNIYHEQAFHKLHNICCIAQAQENDKKKAEYYKVRKGKIVTRRSKYGECCRYGGLGPCLRLPRAEIATLCVPCTLGEEINPNILILYPDPRGLLAFRRWNPLPNQMHGQQYQG